MCMNLLYVTDPKTKKASVSLTMVVVAFGLASLNYALGIIAGTELGPIKIAPFDGGASSLYLSPILALYWGRKASKAKPEDVVAAEPVVDPEV